MTQTAAAPESPPTPAPAASSRPRRALVAVGLAVAVAAGLVVAWLVTGALRPHLYAGTVLQQSTPAPPMDGLTYTDGTAVDLAALRGRTVVVFFGYTNCPDVCPATLSTAARAVDRLGSDGDQVDLLMITVDPSRDTPAELDTYLALFDERFRGVTGHDDHIDLTASLYGVYFDIAAESQATTGGTGAGDAYLVDHTASLLGIGPDGALRVVWPPDVDADDLAADLAALG